MEKLKNFTLVDFKKVLNKENTTLNQLINKGADALVIEAQQKVVDALKEKVAELENTPTEKAKKATALNGFVTFDVVGENKKSKKIGFVKYNRPIDSKHVDKFIHIIASGKYEEAYPVIVTDAVNVLANDYSVTDINGNEVTEEAAADYFAILDGQHRAMAFAKLAAADIRKVIPNVHIRNKENIGEYLVDINEACESWNTKDKFSVAGITSKDDEIFTTLSECISEGFNPSTSSLIYLGKKITSNVLNKVLRGADYKLPKGAEFNKERGNNFITLCKATGMEVNLITKRYFIKGFNSFALATSEEQAFSALKNLTCNELESIKKVKSEEDFISILKAAA